VVGTLFSPERDGVGDVWMGRMALREGVCMCRGDSMEEVEGERGIAGRRWLPLGVLAGKRTSPMRLSLTLNPERRESELVL